MSGRPCGVGRAISGVARNFSRALAARATAAPPRDTVRATPRRASRLAGPHVQNYGRRSNARAAKARAAMTAPTQNRFHEKVARASAARNAATRTRSRARSAPKNRPVGRCRPIITVPAASSGRRRGARCAFCGAARGSKRALAPRATAGPPRPTARAAAAAHVASPAPTRKIMAAEATHAGGARAANDGAHAAMAAPTRTRLLGKVARASPPRNAATRSADLMQFLGRFRLYGAGRVT
jgi:hypothetical protein